MIADYKQFPEPQRNLPTNQALKKPIKVVMSNGEYHIARRSGDRKKEQENSNNNNNNNLNSNNTTNNNNLNNTTSNGNNNNLNNNSNSNNTKAYFGSPVPMFGGAFPCGSPFYPGPPTPPLEDWQADGGDPELMNDVEFVDDDRNATGHETAKKFNQQQQQQQQHQGLLLFPCGSPRLDDYLSASSSDDDDDEVCRLMFMRGHSTSANNNNNNNITSTTEQQQQHTNSINTRSRTSQRFGQTLQGQVTSSVRGQARDQTSQPGVQHGRVHKRFRAIDVTSVGNQRPSLNFRKMRRSSFHRKHHRLEERLSNQIQTSLSTFM